MSEALDLKLDDVDIEQVCSRSGRPSSVELVSCPLHSSTRLVLIEYLRRRKQFLGERPSNYVFVSNRGTRLDIGRVHRAFYALSRQNGPAGAQRA